MANEVLEEAIRLSRAGGAICLTGAGYSLNATDQNGRAVPSTADLEAEIKEVCGIDPNERASLSDLADFCEESADLKRKVQLLLLRRLTLCHPTKSQKLLMELPWRSVFTTNFDDIVERCFKPNTFKCVTPSSEAPSYLEGITPIYYMHGRARDLLERDTDPSMVLSERNYLQLKDKNRNLYSALQNELVCARAIIILGYSLRDLEIARLFLSTSEQIKNKTYIVCSPTDNKISISRLSKFGHVLPIGNDEFASAVLDFPRADEDTSSIRFLDELVLQPLARDEDMAIADLDSLILSGIFDGQKYLTQKVAATTDLMCVERTGHLTAILENSNPNLRRFLVTSDIGNGKSIFLEQLCFSAASMGIRVYRVNSNLQEVFTDIEIALSRPGQSLFVVDDVVRYKSVTRFIGARISTLHTLVCSTRDDIDTDVFNDYSSQLGGVIKEINLDRLSDVELQSWDSLLERWGFWEAKTGNTPAERIKFLKEECRSENRSIILSVFKSSFVSRKIDDIVTFFVKRRPEHAEAFVAMLIMSLCQRHVQWPDIVRWCGIDDQALRVAVQGDEIFGFVGKSRDNWYLLTSTQLASYILRTRAVEISDRLMVDVYVKIVRETAYSANDRRSGFDAIENLKELMKFRFLTRLFGDMETSVALVESVYRSLSSVPRIRSNDQFWLQYAMARSDAGDLATAERYLNDALAIALSKGATYSPHQIYDQMVRLLFRKNAVRGRALNIKEAVQAITYLKELLKRPDSEIIYPVRAVPFISEFVEVHADQIPKDMRDKLSIVLQEMLGKVSTTRALPGAKQGETTLARKSLLALINMIKFI